jgi:hypothetical protein
MERNTDATARAGRLRITFFQIVQDFWCPHAI